MEPEEVAGEEDPILDKPGDLGFGPVRPRRDEELERPVTERKGLAVCNYHKSFLRDMQQGNEEIPALCICNHPASG